MRSGHPWVFADSVRSLHREGVTGDLGVIFDRRDRFLAIGLYDATSPIRLRILHSGAPEPLDEAWWRRHLMAAVDRRAALFGPDTTGHRWIHGENDGWPGLVLDRYGTTLVMKLYTAAWLRRIPGLTALLSATLAPDRIVVRFSRNVRDAAAAAGFPEGHEAGPAAGPAQVPFLERGLIFEAGVLRGQKTGFFLDQRENRRRVGSFTSGARVLNLFSHTGGFSVHAARGGARTVTDLDISAPALAEARRNLEANRHLPGVREVRHEVVQADAFEWLAQRSPPEFDVVVVDPPSLARREAERTEALDAYGHLVRGALRRLRPGGRLVAASCSAHVSAPEFFGVVRAGVVRSGRPFAEQATTGHPPDHPATFPEAAYLKAIYLRLEPAGQRD